jgi:hypothetical protein
MWALFGAMRQNFLLREVLAGVAAKPARMFHVKHLSRERYDVPGGFT